MTEQNPTRPKGPPLEVTMHESPKAVDVFLFPTQRVAEVVFPIAIRPAGVLVLACTDQYRDMLRGRAVRNFYNLANDAPEVSWQVETMAKAIRDRMLSYGSVVDVMDDWPGLRRAGSPEKVAELLELLHRAFTLSKSGTPPTAEEMRAIMEGKHVH